MSTAAEVPSSGLTLAESTSGGDGSITVLHCTGYVDGETYPSFESRVRGIVERGPRFIVLDLTGVVFVNSMGWGLVLSQLKKLRARNGRVVIAGLSSSVASGFQLLGLEQVLPTFPSSEAAVKSLASEAGPPGSRPPAPG